MIDLPPLRSEAVKKTDPAVWLLRTRALISFENTTIPSSESWEIKPPVNQTVIDKISEIANFLDIVKKTALSALLDLSIISGEVQHWLEQRATQLPEATPLRQAMSAACRETLDKAKTQEALNAIFSSERLRNSLSFLIDDERLSLLLRPDYDIELADLLLTVGCLSQSEVWNEVFLSNLANSIAANFTLPEELPEGLSQFTQDLLNLAKNPSPSEENSFALDAILGRIPNSNRLQITRPDNDLTITQQIAEGFISLLLEKKSEISSLLSEGSRICIYNNIDGLSTEVLNSSEYKLAEIQGKFTRRSPISEDELRARAKNTLAGLIPEDEISQIDEIGVADLTSRLHTLNILSSTHDGLNLVLRALLKQMAVRTFDNPDSLSSLIGSDSVLTYWASSLTPYLFGMSNNDSAISSNETKIAETDAISTDIEANGKNRPALDTPSGLLVRLDDLISSYEARRQFTAELQGWQERVVGRGIACRLPADDFIPLLAQLAEAINKHCKNPALSEAVRTSFKMDLELARKALVEIISESRGEITRLTSPKYRVRGFQVGDYRGPTKIVYGNGEKKSQPAVEVAFNLLLSTDERGETAIALAEAIKSRLTDDGEEVGIILDLDNNPLNKFLSAAWNIHRDDPLERCNPSEIFSKVLLGIVEDRLNSNNSQLFELLADPHTLASSLLHAFINIGAKGSSPGTIDKTRFIKIFENIRTAVMTANSNPQSDLHTLANQLVSKGLPGKIDNLLEEIRSGGFFRENDGGRYLREYLSRRTKPSAQTRSLPVISNDKLPSSQSISGLQLLLARTVRSRQEDRQVSAAATKTNLQDALNKGLLRRLPAEHFTSALIELINQPQGAVSEDLKRCLIILGAGTIRGVPTLRNLRGQAEDGTPVYVEPKDTEMSESGEVDALSVIVGHHYRDLTKESPTGNLSDIIRSILDISDSFEDKLAPTYLIPFNAILAIAAAFKESSEQLLPEAVGLLKIASTHPDYLRELKFIFNPSAIDSERSKLETQLSLIAREEAAQITRNLFEQISRVGLSKDSDKINPALKELSSELLIWWSRTGIIPDGLNPEISAEVQTAKDITEADALSLMSAGFKDIDLENDDWEHDWRKHE